MTIASLSDSDLKLLVSRRQPAYVGMVDHWNFCQDTYKGGRQWFVKNVHRYIKEGDVEYRDRVNRAYRFNHTREVVSLLTKYVFKEGVIRNSDDAPTCVKNFWLHATLSGGDIDSLMKQAATQSSVTGGCWIITDTTAQDDKPLTVAEANKTKTNRVYAYIVKPQDMLDFSIDQTGELNWILFRVKHRDDTDPLKSSGRLANRYILWTKTDFLVVQEAFDPQTIAAQNTIVTSNGPAILNSADNVKLQIVASGPNLLNVIPAVRVPHAEDNDIYSPHGLVDDIVYLDRANANYLSNLDAIIQDQTFSQLVMPAAALNTGIADEDMSKKLTEMGTKRIFTYASDSAAAPKYISPDASQASVISGAIQTNINEIYHSIGMSGERTKQDNAMGVDNSSGVAKAYDFDRLNAMLRTKARRLEDVENALVELVCKWSSVSEIEVADEQDLLVKYPETYDVRGIPDEFDIAQNLMLIEAPDTVRRQQMVQMLPKLFARLPQSVRDEMEKDIQSWPPDPMEQATAMMKMIGNNGAVKPSIVEQTQPQPTGGQGTQPNQLNGAAGTKAPGKSTQGQNNGDNAK